MIRRGRRKSWLGRGREMVLGRVYGRWGMINENTNDSGVSGEMPKVVMGITWHTYHRMALKVSKGNLSCY